MTIDKFDYCNIKGLHEKPSIEKNVIICFQRGTVCGSLIWKRNLFGLSLDPSSRKGTAILMN